MELKKEYNSSLISNSPKPREPLKRSLSQQNSDPLQQVLTPFINKQGTKKITL